MQINISSRSRAFPAGAGNFAIAGTIIGPSTLNVLTKNKMVATWQCKSLIQYFQQEPHSLRCAVSANLIPLWIHAD